MKQFLALALGAAMIAGAPVQAETSAWDDIRDAIYGDHFLFDGSAHIAITAPYRAPDDARAIIGADIALPDGQRVSRVHVVLDNNPVPVSAVFTLAEPMERFSFDVTMRINGPTPLHITAESARGQVYVAESFVKTTGLGACSAPPGTDVEEALATLGEMVIEFAEPHQQVASASALPLPKDLETDSRARVGVSHPSHSGMAMDQITLLFVPMRTVETLEIESNSNAFLRVDGSISLSENPEVSFSIPSSTFELGVTMTDTDGTVTTETKRRLVQ